MTSGSIQYRLPTSRAFAGMKRALFQPFDLGKWFVLGFTAWLAGLLDGGGSGGGAGGGDNSGGSTGGGAWLMEHLPIVILIGALVLVIVLVMILALLWVSSRGKFMFLDNVVHNRAEVKDPWNRFRALGDSLFRWRLVFGLIVFVVILLIAGACWLLAISLGAWAAIIAVILMLSPVIVALIYITILLDDFVIPLMYKHSLTTNEAWKRFLEVHHGSWNSFVLYALWKALLCIAAIGCILAFGICTLLIGFILMIIPYIGAVVLLPVSVFFRFLGPEFLRQFGSDYDILPSMEEAPEGGA